MKAVAETNIGKKRNINQDFYVSDPANGIFIVADGLGGYALGEVASEFAAKNLHRRMIGLSRSEFANRIEEIVHEVNDALVRCAAQKHGGVEMGTTILALMFFGDVFGVVSVGDTELFGYSDGVLESISRSHSLASELKLSQDEARTFNKAHIVTSALGKGFLESIDSSIRPIQHSRYLLCTDGLTRKAFADQIAQVLKETEFEQSANQLVDLALEVDSSDNITVVVVDPQ